jgi:hypothetical protein
MNCYAKCASNASLFFSTPRALSSPMRVTSGAGGVALAFGATQSPVFGPFAFYLVAFFERNLHGNLLLPPVQPGHCLTPYRR